MDSAESAVGVLNDLLNYDKIELGELSYEASIMPIWNVIDHTVMEFQASAMSRGIDYRFRCYFPGYDSINQNAHASIRDLPTDLHELRTVGDKIRCVQVIRNLISNAIKFTPSGGHIEISVSIVQSGDAVPRRERFDDLELVNCKETLYFERRGDVRITVRDSGVGLTPQQVGRLFRHGVQFNVNDLQAGQGSGLGLYIAKG